MTNLLLLLMLGSYFFSSCNLSAFKMKDNSIDSVKAKIIVLRQCGFFENYASINNEQLFATLHQQRINAYSQMFGHFYDPGMELTDNEILSLDRSSAVAGDAEADVGRGNDRYVNLIKAFAEASEGLFVPTDIKETWGSEQGPIIVSFKNNFNKIEFHPKYYDDWISEEVFDVINREMIKKGNQKFYMFLGKDGRGLGQYFLYVRMTEKQRDIVEKRFGWKFSS